MAILDTLLDVYQLLFSSATEASSWMASFVMTLVNVNYEFVTTVFQFLYNLLACVAAGAQMLAIVCSTIMVCLRDFTFELLAFLRSLLFLVWKLLVLLFYLMDLVFHVMEYSVLFIWNGGKWTAKTIQVSAQNLTENGLSTWRYFVVSLKEFTDSVIGGFEMIGQCGSAVWVFLLNAVSWCNDCVTDMLVSVDSAVRSVASNFLDSVYHFLTVYLMNMPKEAYLGMMLCCVFCLTYRSVAQFMCSRGLTFPLLSYLYPQEPRDGEEYYADAGMEFSDDEMGGLGDVEYQEDSSDTGSELEDSSFDEEEDEEDEELEVNSDNESTISDSELSDINIELPAPDRHYNLRQSVTPAREKVKSLSPDEFEREIESEKEKRICIVCHDRKKSVLILPCKHMCLCVNCGNQIARARTRAGRVCPLCRTRIQTIMNIYV